MLDQVINLGLQSVARSAESMQRVQRLRPSSQLAHYPKLLTMLHAAEKTGVLSAERRYLESKRRFG